LSCPLSNNPTSGGVVREEKEKSLTQMGAVTKESGGIMKKMKKENSARACPELCF
jgi:hypothetical protein